jgi:anti-anti-sigma regulatory factor
MTQITEDTFEQVHHVFIEATIIDLRNTTFIDPFGMVGLLEIGELSKLKGINKTVFLPESDEVLKYLERMDFFRFADR